jgi:hypothetical protein
MTPRYKHDCDDCVFLGRYEHADLYHCRVRSLMPEGTLLARQSSEPSHYWSMWPGVFLPGQDYDDLIARTAPALAEAARLAKAKGLI